MSAWIIILILVLIFLTQSREKLTNYEAQVLQARRELYPDWRLRHFRKTNSFAKKQMPNTFV